MKSGTKRTIFLREEKFVFSLMNASLLAFLLLSLALTCICDQTVSMGAGSYYQGIPDGLLGASSLQNCGNPNAPGFVPAVFKSTDAIQAPFPTNKWWSSALWRRCLNVEDTLGSEVMYPHPLAVKALRSGMAIAHPRESVFIQSSTISFIQEYKYPFYPWDLVVTVEGSPLGSALVEDYSDMHVRLFWPTSQLRATFGRGSPFVWFQVDTIMPVILTQGRLNVFYNAPGALAFSLQTFRGPAIYHHYAVYFDDGAMWDLKEGFDSNGAPQTTLSCGGCKQFALAVLPDALPDVIELYRCVWNPNQFV